MHVNIVCKLPWPYFNFDGDEEGRFRLTLPLGTGRDQSQTLGVT